MDQERLFEDDADVIAEYDRLVELMRESSRLNNSILREIRTQRNPERLGELFAAAKTAGQQSKRRIEAVHAFYQTHKQRLCKALGRAA